MGTNGKRVGSGFNLGEKSFLIHITKRQPGIRFCSMEWNDRGVTLIIFSSLSSFPLSRYSSRIKQKQGTQDAFHNSRTVDVNCE